MCGLIGIVTAHKDRDFRIATQECVDLLVPGLKYMKRRGPNSFGAAFANPANCHILRKVYTGRSVDDVLHELRSLAFVSRASIMLGQTKWLTDYTKGKESHDKAVLDANTQPIHLFFDGDNGVCSEAVGIHNGNFPADQKEKMKRMVGFPSQSTAEVDSRHAAELYMQLVREMGDEWEAAKWFIENIGGAYTFGYSEGDSLVVFKDKRGYRPGCVGRIKDSLVFSSESGFFEEMGIEFLREINPGEMIKIDSRGELEEKVLVEAAHSPCPFEDIYFKDWMSRGNDGETPVSETREILGGKIVDLYRPELKNVDMVSFAPDSGRSYVYGVSGFRIGEALRKPLIHEKVRHFIVRGGHKYVANTPLIRGKNLAILDDSIMRGDSILEMYALLKEAGVKEVHFISAWPPNFFHCNKGIDTPTDEELIAYRLIEDRTVEYSPESGVRYNVRDVNRRMTEIMREELFKKYGGRYNPKDIYVHYGTIEMLRSVLPTKDNCEFCITGIDPELRQ